MIESDDLYGSEEDMAEDGEVELVEEEDVEHEQADLEALFDEADR